MLALFFFEGGNEMKDIVIIGAGIIGSFLAYDLSRYELDIALIERCQDVGCGATKANSAIVHSGHDPKEGTLKAKLNVKGNRMYESICRTLGCHYEKTGAYVLACGLEEEKTVKTLYHQARHRDIECSLHLRDEILKKEPHLSDEVTLGLYLPTTAIITPWEVAISLVENAVVRGCELQLGTEVQQIEKIEKGYRVHTSRGYIDTKMIINCAGVFADEIAKMLNHDTDLFIRPRRGEYFVLDHQKEPIVSSVMYPVPSEKGKGVLLVPTIHKNLLLGPTSDFIDEKDDVSTTASGLDYVRSQVGKLVKDIPMDKVIRTFSGNRPVGTTGDFILKEDEHHPCVIHAAAIESPGIASAPAISQYVIETFVSKRIDLLEKKELPEIVTRPKSLNELSEHERIEKIRQDSRYGHIVCRCEKISEGEIVEAVHRIVPAATIGAIKRRLRPGMGRCQGGFCEPVLVKILAQQLNCSVMDILMEETGSQILLSER